MKKLFTTKRFKIVVAIIVLLLVGALICAMSGYNRSAQSSIVGTIFAPAQWVATKVSDGITDLFGEASGNKEYLERIDELEQEVGELQSKLADYDELQKQNSLYKEALELKEENEDFNFVEATVISRDAADIFASYTINKGTASGISEGDAVTYGSYIIGIINKAYPTYSVVKTILDPDFSVSAYEIESGEISYVTGEAVLAASGTCKMTNLDSTTSVKEGSIIATAGISGKVPKGLIIGTVTSMDMELTSIAQYAVITPGTNVQNIANCLVITDFESED